MAGTATLELVDDMDGTGGARRHTLVLDGNVRQIDLGERNYQAMLSALAPFLRRSRRAPGAGVGLRRGEGAVIRAFARERGYPVAERGRIPTYVLTAWHAHQLVVVHERPGAPMNAVVV